MFTKSVQAELIHNLFESWDEQCLLFEFWVGLKDGFAYISNFCQVLDLIKIGIQLIVYLILEIAAHEISEIDKSWISENWIFTEDQLGKSEGKSWLIPSQHSLK